MLKGNDSNNFFLKQHSSKLTFKKIKNLIILFTPTFLNQGIEMFFSLMLFVGGGKRAYRNLFGYPARGQRSWSNGKTVQKCNGAVFNFKYNKLRRLNKKLNLTKNLFLAEYINLLWQKNWSIEWHSVRPRIRNIPFYVKNKQYIDITNMLGFNIQNFLPNSGTKKIKPHRRKRKIITNKFSTGFPFGFTIRYANQLKNLK